MANNYDFIKDADVLRVIKNNLSNITTVSGLYNAITREIKATLDRCEGEKVISGHSNCFIVLGNDRPSGKSSGYGGKGHGAASAIDIIAGLSGQMPIEKLFLDKVFTPKDFKNDASRIYISHKSDVDKYFEIPVVSVTIGKANIRLLNSEGKAAVAIKSDHVRVIGREQIKIITNHGGKNSLNRTVNKGGIAILAGYDKMAVDKTLAPQPMVKGNNLVELLTELINRIQDVEAIVLKFTKNQKKINDQLMSHSHQSDKAGLATSKLIGEDGIIQNFNLLKEVIPDIITSLVHKQKISTEYFSTNSDKCIYSSWNVVN